MSTLGHSTNFATKCQLTQPTNSTKESHTDLEEHEGEVIPKHIFSSI